jgi:hypothetical protein
MNTPPLSPSRKENLFLLFPVFLSTSTKFYIKTHFPKEPPNCLVNATEVIDCKQFNDSVTGIYPINSGFIFLRHFLLQDEQLMETGEQKSVVHWRTSTFPSGLPFFAVLRNSVPWMFIQCRNTHVDEKLTQIQIYRCKINSDICIDEKLM